MQIEEEEDEIFVFLNNKTSHRLSTTNADDDSAVALAAATETIFNTNRSSSTVNCYHTPTVSEIFALCSIRQYLIITVVSIFFSSNFSAWSMSTYTCSIVGLDFLLYLYVTVICV